MSPASFPASASTERIHHSRRIALAIGLTVAVLALAYCWFHGGEYRLLVALQPSFHVTQIDAQAGTLTIENKNEGFVLNCKGACESFELGHRYPLLYQGQFMEYRSAGKIFRFPILKQHVNFDVIGGRG